ncbi:acyl-CoA dehydrogenase family protein [Skermania sp. ID1734]|uniref:acyl-CoA dehydrogenase family protein n=1 Tax=Skermania sp. ID1734 TaxID=2597516 RepID=UPI002107FDD8|nr:acyl-CoA dehydrogenase family protein [Skermania sp. ID1734]
MEVRVQSVSSIAEEISRDIAGPAADGVDRDARFPIEAVTAIREAGLLGALVPKDLGGLGASLTDISHAVRVLAHSCASTAMVLAMHSIEVASLVRHGETEWMRDFVSRIARDRLLLANAGSEVGVGGGGWSICAVETNGEQFRLEKEAATVSFGRYADCLVVAARRTPESVPGDQVAVLCFPPALELREIGPWDTFGLRGTCSNAFHISASGSTDQILPDTAAVQACTYVPVANILRGSAWLGIAESAFLRAQKVVSRQARKQIGETPDSALALADLVVTLQAMRDSVQSSIHDFGPLVDVRPPTRRESVRMDTVKLSQSQALIEIVIGAATICGISGYRLDSPDSMSRIIRDALSAPIMVNNGRIRRSNAELLLGVRNY